MRILLVEDDEIFAQSLISTLSEQHYAVDWANDGDTAWNYAQAVAYDLILLDVNLPKRDGISLCRQLRALDYNQPILLLTARGASQDIVQGLDAGADEYVVKPCSLVELSARIRALLRRRDTSTTPMLKWGELSLNLSTCEVTFHAQPISLSPKEYKLLELFLRHPHRVFNSSTILERIWSFEDSPGEETVRTHVKRLRRKLKSFGVPELIETVYGIGYRLKTLAEEEEKPPEPAEPVAVSQQAREKAIALWETFRTRIFDRLSILEQAVTRLQSHQSLGELADQAQQAAHKLAGSLGMFGFPQGSQLARDLETSLQASEATLDHTSFALKVTQLRDILQQPPYSSAAQPSQMETAEPSLVVFPPKPQQSKFEPSWLQKICILAVDDDPIFLESLTQILVNWGMNVTVLSDLNQFWSVLETVNPDLVILDLEMPPQDGIVLCEALRSHPTWQDLLIIFLTSCTEPALIERIYGAGADDCITKPLTELNLSTRILSRLARYQALQQRADIDRLTGGLNQAGARKCLERYLSLAQRYQQPVSIAIAIYEQPLTPTTLKAIAMGLQPCFNTETVFARWDYQTFLMGWYGIDGQEAIAQVNELWQTRVAHVPSLELQFWRLGAATSSTTVNALNALIDKALSMATHLSQMP